MKDTARRAIAATLITGLVKSEGDHYKAELLAAFNESGAERVRVTDVDGTDLGSVSKSKGRISARVTDEAALLEWVKVNHPEHILRQVNATYRDQLLAVAKTGGDPIDPETGELVPGIEIFEGDPSVSARPTPEAKDRMRALLAGSGLLEIGRGDGA